MFEKIKKYFSQKRIKRRLKKYREKWIEDIGYDEKIARTGFDDGVDEITIEKWLKTLPRIIEKYIENDWMPGNATFSHDVLVNKLDEEMAKYLLEMLNHIGLGKHIK